MKQSFSILFFIFCIFPTNLLDASSSASASVENTRKDIPDELHISLQQAIKKTLDSNRQLLSSLYTVQQQQLTLETEKSEFDYKFFPVADTGFDREGETIGLGVTMQKKFTSGPKIEITPRYGSINSSRYTGKLTLALTIPLLKGSGKAVNLDTINSSTYLVEKSKNSHRAKQEQVVLDTISAVYNIINKQEIEKIYTISINDLHKEVKSAQIKAKVGLAGPLDIYRAEIELKEAEDNQIFSQTELKRAKDRLKILLSLPLVTQISVSAPTVVENLDLTLEEAIQTALTKKNEFKQIHLDLNETQRKIEIAKHNLLPQADLAVRYDNSNIDIFGSSDDEQREFWSVRLISSTDLARKRQKAAFTSRLLELERTKLAALETRDKIEEDIANQFTLLSQGQKRLAIRKKQINHAEQKLARSTIKFKHGMANNFDLISSEKELQSSKINLLQVETEYILGTFRLRQMIGTLLEE